MLEVPRCPVCQTPLPRDAPEGFCPRCSFNSALRAKPAGAAPGTTTKPGGGAGIITHEVHSAHRFGDYELLEEIACGGMGIVYKARQCSLDRIVALKLLLFGAHTAPEAIQRFYAGSMAAVALRHPNIVDIHEVGICEGQHYLSMEFIAGKSLSALIRDRPLPPGSAARYVRIIAEAIHYAHEHGVLHCDLKPSNVLIDGNDQPHVTDFGLAKRLADDSQATLSDQVVGSPSYISPEQALGAHSKLSRRCDVYALGALLFHALTGRPPFMGESAADVVHQVLTLAPMPPRLLNPGVPCELEAICVKCLEKEPVRRYATAQELASALSQFLAESAGMAQEQI